METLDNKGIKLFVVTALKNSSFQCLFLFFCLFMLSTVSVNASQIVFIKSSYESTAKWETCQIFKEVQIVGVHLTVASVTKTATLLGVSSAAVSKVMMAYTNRGKTQSATRNSGYKQKLRKGDHCTLKGTVSKNYRITAAKVTAELNIHPEDHVSTKKVQ